MPTVRTAVEIPGVTAEHVWNVVSEYERYPAVMANVLSVAFLERTEHRTVSAWRVLLEGTELTWEENDTFEPPYRIRFEQIDGDLDLLRGGWELTETGHGVRVELSLEFDIGIPSLADVLNPIGVRAIEANAHSMLTAIGEQVSMLEPVP
jgi:ribosome-associated toxin RatA of RatAB toxin-antitoxin module